MFKKRKKIFLLFVLLLLSASCNPFAKNQQAGIYKTSNGGTDWQAVNALKTGGSISLARVTKMYFDPKNHETVFAGTHNQGLLRSTDFGVSWEKILSKILVFDVAIDPNKNSTIYAAGTYNGFGKILKTEDSGKSWVEVYNEQGSENPVRALVLDTGNPMVIYAGTTAGNVVKSVDAGKSWKLLYSFNDRVQKIGFQNNRVYVLTRSKGLFAASSSSVEVFTNLTEKLTTLYDSQNFGFNQAQVGTFNQFFVDEASGNLIYLTTDKGLHKSVDFGQNWQFMPLPIKQGDSFARAIAISKNSSNIVYVSVGTTVYKSTDGGQSFQTQGLQAGGYINYILVDPQYPQIAFAGIYYDQ